MTYRTDKDLEFMKHCKSEDLEILVAILTKDNDGKKRLTEELTMNDRYIKYNPDHCQYWDVISGELQCFGANTFLTILRGGKGILYQNMLTEVCDKMKVDYNSDSSVEIIEMNLLIKILIDSMENMTPEQLQEIVKNLNLETTNLSKQAVVAALQASVRFSGFAAYQVAVIVANAISPKR